MTVRTLLTLIVLAHLAVSFPFCSVGVGNLVTAPSATQLSLSSVHRTYWLVGDAFFNWNGSKANAGPLVLASDGDNVTIMLLSNDTAPHNWYLDLNNNFVVDAAEIPTKSPDFNSRTTWLNFTFTPSLGTIIPHGGKFTYRCSYHATMYGEFKFNAGPVASFGYSPKTPLVGHLASFNASTSWPSTDATLTSYAWAFGDGNTTITAGATASHSYSVAGNFTITLSVTDSLSQKASTSKTMTIENIPPVPFDYGISVSPNSANVIQSKSTNVTVSLYLVSGIPENVSLSLFLAASERTIRISLNTSSGFPSFSTTLSIATALSSPNGTYTVTIRGVSSTGVAHNATFTMNLKPSPPIANGHPADYVLPSIVVMIAAMSVVAAFFVLKRSRKRQGLARKTIPKGSLH